MPILKILGSLGSAVFLIASLAVILSFSTVMESLQGTPFAQENFYRAHWFDLFLFFVWVNIFCATLTRFPFKKKHVGFVITHLGILLLLAGSLLTRLSGQEGQMTLFEGESKDHMLQEGLTLRVSGPLGADKRYELKPKPLKRPLDIEIPGSSFGLQIAQVLPHALEIKSLEESPSAPVNHALEAELSSEMLGMRQNIVLIENDPFDAGSSSKSLGPATFKLQSGVKEGTKNGPPVLRLWQSSTGETFEIPMKEDIPPTEWKKTGLRISSLKYYPNARVENNRLANVGSGHLNPAAEFEVSDELGHREHHTKFTLFPDFNSLRGGEVNNVFDLSVRLDLPAVENAQEDVSPAFIFSVSPDNPWSYRVRSSKNPDAREKPFSQGEKIPTGWMDMQVQVKKTFSHAQVSKSVQSDPEEKSETPALQIRVLKQDGTNQTHWLLVGHSLLIGKEKTILRVSAELKSTPLPFSLRLKDFRKIDYPGTTNPASFESDVVLVDPAERVTLERTIRMNKPLDYRGYRVFQSSYMQDESLGEASVFTIAKNPGMRLIYPGAGLIFAGVILLFYFHPFFSAAERGGSRSRKK